MGVLPTIPDRVSDFDQPTIHPWQIGAQFAEHERVFKELLGFLQGVFRDDGALKNRSVGPEQLATSTTADLSKDVVAGMNALLAGIRREAAKAAIAMASVQALREEIRSQLKIVVDNAASTSRVAELVRLRAERLSNLPETVEAGVEPRLGSTLPTGLLGPGAGGFYGVDTLGAAATAQDYAQVAIEWAEHMPDTIPPNILAINAITGDHWSSRWWANRALEAVGGFINAYYLGPSAVPPTTTPTGDPIPEGSIYYDTTYNQMYVWNGTSWQPFTQPSVSATSTLVYSATANQTVFPLTTNDIYGNNVTLLSDGSQGVIVHLSGARLYRTQGAVTGDWSLNVATSTITLTEAVTVNAVLVVDVLVPPSELAPGIAKMTKVLPITPNGTTVSFLLLDMSSAQLTINDPSQIFCSIDGVTQEPLTDYTISGDHHSIVFSSAPASDCKIFMVAAKGS